MRFGTILVSLALVAATLPATHAFAADEGTVELGLSLAKNEASSPDPGEEASVELGLRLGLDTTGAPASDPGSGEVLIGIAVGYDRIVEEGYVIRLDAAGGSVSPDRLVLRPDRAYEEDKTGTVPEPAGFVFGDGRVPVPERAGYDFEGWFWDPSYEGDPALGYDADGSPTALSYDEVRARAGETLYARWSLAACAKITLAGATSASGSGNACIWYWPGKGYAPVDPAVDAEAAEAVLAAKAGDALGVRIGQLPYPSYASQYFAGWAPEMDAEPGACVLSCEKGADGYAFALAEAAFGEAFTQAVVDMATAGVDVAWHPVFETAQISVTAPFKVTFKARSDGGAASVEELEQLADEKDLPSLDGIFSEPFSATDIEALLSGTDKFLLSPQAFTNTSASACDVYVSSVECANAGASALLPGGNLNVEVFSLAERPSAVVPTDQQSAVRFGYAGGVSKVTVGRDEPLSSKIVLPRPLRGEDGTVTYEPRILWYGLDLAASGFDTVRIAFSGNDDPESYVATLANVKYTYSVAL